MNVKNLKSEIAFLVLLLAIIFYGLLGINTEAKASTITQTSGSTSSKVTVAVTGVSLNKTVDTLTEGKTDTLLATIAPSNAANTNVIWSTSNINIAKVDPNGVVTAVNAGTATITVKTVDGNKTANCVVTVINSTTQIVLRAGKSYEFNNLSDKQIQIKNNSDYAIKYDYESIYGNGQTQWYRNTNGNIVIPAKGKTVVTVRDKDISCLIPNDIYNNMSYKESSVKALTEFTLKAGKSYEFNNLSNNQIQIKNNSDYNTIKYDYVLTYGTGLTQWYRNTNGDIGIASKGKTVVTVRDKDITCWMPSDVYNSISYKESSVKALTEFTLKAGKSYEFNSLSDKQIQIKNSSDYAIKYDYESTYGNGQTQSYRNTNGDILIPTKGKTVVTLRNQDIICWMPSDTYNSISYKESSVKALTEFTLKAGKSYEFNSLSDKQIQIKNSSDYAIKYDYESTYGNGQTQSYRNTNGDVLIPAKGKTVVTLRNQDIICWMPSDTYNSISYKESSVKALTEFTLKAGKSYEFNNAGNKDIQISNNSDYTTKYNYVSIDPKAHINFQSDTSGSLRVQAQGKLKIIVGNKDITCWYPANSFQSDIQYKTLDMPSPEQGKITVLKNEILKNTDGKLIVISYIGNGSKDNKKINVIGEMKDNNNKNLEVIGSSVTTKAQSISIVVLSFNSKYPTNNIEVHLPEDSKTAGISSYGTRQEDGKTITTGVAVNNTDKKEDMGISSIAYDEKGNIIEGRGTHNTIQPNSINNLNVTLDSKNKKVGNVDTYVNNNIISNSGTDETKCEYADQLMGSYYSGANTKYNALYGVYNIQDDRIQANIDVKKVLSDKSRNSCVTLPTGSYVTVGFQKPVIGTIYVSETGAAGDYGLVLASSDDKNYSKIGVANTGVVTGFNLKEHGFDKPVTSVTVIGLDNNGNWPGFDLVYVKGDGVIDKIINHDISGKSAKDSIEKQYKQYKDDQSMSKDPIDLSTGAHVLDRTLLRENGAQNFDFRVTYDSLLLGKGIMGNGWENNYDTKLQSTTSGSVYVDWSSNHKNEFVLIHDNVYESHDISMKNYSLIKNTDGSYRLTDKDKNLYEFNKLGQLVNKKDRNAEAINYNYDNSGKLIKVTENISGKYFNFEYNKDGLLQKVSDGLSRSVSFKYDNKSNLISIVDANGNIINYVYDNKGQVISAAYGNGVQIFKDTYDEKGRVISQDDSLNNNKLTTFIYDETSEQGHIITTVSDRNGNKKVLTHDSNYNLLKVKDELGRVKSYTYDDLGNRLTETDENGNTTKYAYDDRGNVTSVTDPLGNVTKMTYDSNNNLLSVQNNSGKKTVNTYDSNNNLLTVTDTLGNVTKNTYDSNGQLISVKNKNGGLTKYTYKNGLLTEEANSLGNKIDYEYDAAGRKIKAINEMGKVTNYKYDNNDNVIAVMDPLGNKISSTYDMSGNKLTTTDAKGNTTKYTYDTNGNLTATTDPLGNTVTYKYDGEGRLIKTTDKNGNSTTYTYDAKGRKTAVTDALGNTINMNYDSVGNIVNNIDALGNTVSTNTYDKLNRFVSTKDALNNGITNSYDNVGRLQSVTDDMGNSTKFTYDDLDRLISSRDSLNGKSSQSFDAEGNKTSLTDSNGNKVTYNYDSEGRVIFETSSSGKTIKYEYNPKGQLSKMTNGRGQVTTYSYDSAGKLIGFNDNLGNVQYTYDANGNITSIKDSSGNISKQYDALNRVTKYTDASGNTIGYAYDANGNITSITYPNGKKVQYTYDAANKLKKVTDWNNNVTSYGYDSDGRLIKETKPDGSVCTYTYDKASQMLEIKDVDKNGNVINKYNYLYDANGNINNENSYIKDKDIQVGNVNMTYGKDNRIATYNGQKIVFDADGNMINGSLNNKMIDYKYDCRNRLISIGNTKYGYDALNNRIAVSDNGNKASYVVNPNAGLSQVLVKKDADGKETYYIYGLGLISEQTSSGDYRVYHFDKRGSTTALTDKTGKVTDRFQYDAYGKLVNHDGNSKTPFLYVGRDGVMLDDNGLYYMRARYYNADIKRFVNQDVVVGDVKDGQSLNRFAYVGSNPIMCIDPLGTFSISSDTWNKVGLTVKALGNLTIGTATAIGGAVVAGGIEVGSGGLATPIAIAAGYSVVSGVSTAWAAGNDIVNIWNGNDIRTKDDLGKDDFLKNSYTSLFGNKWGNIAYSAADLISGTLTGSGIIKDAKMIYQEGVIGTTLLTDKALSWKDKLKIGWELKGEIFGNFKEMGYFRDMMGRKDDWLKIGKCLG